MVPRFYRDLYKAFMCICYESIMKLSREQRDNQEEDMKRDGEGWRYRGKHTKHIVYEIFRK